MKSPFIGYWRHRSSQLNVGGLVAIISGLPSWFRDFLTRIRQNGRARLSYLRDSLMTRVKDNAEIEALYVLHGPALTLMAQTMVGERSRAQDAVQKVFLELMETGALERVTDKAAYIFKCVRNAVLNERKRQNRTVPLTPDFAWFHPPLRDFAEERSLRRALLALPEDQRHVVILHVWGELSFAQVSDVLDIPANTAASRYRYAIGKLRASMLERESSHAG